MARKKQIRVYQIVLIELVNDVLYLWHCPPFPSLEMYVRIPVPQLFVHNFVQPSNKLLSPQEWEEFLRLVS